MAVRRSAAALALALVAGALLLDPAAAKLSSNNSITLSTRKRNVCVMWYTVCVFRLHLMQPSLASISVARAAPGTGAVPHATSRPPPKLLHAGRGGVRPHQGSRHVHR